MLTAGSQPLCDKEAQVEEVDRNSRPQATVPADLLADSQRETAILEVEPPLPHEVHTVSCPHQAQPKLQICEQNK